MYNVKVQLFILRIVMHPVHVSLLGDSTIDNVYWLRRSRGDVTVEEHLSQELGSGYKVKNLAYDGFTTTSVLEGDQVGKVLGCNPAYLRTRGIDPNTTSYFVHPLNELKKHVEAHPDETHYVVLSVAGNDFRENLLKPHRLLLDIPKILQRYMRIVDEIKLLKGKDIRPILMFQYRLDAKTDYPYYIYTVMKVIGFIGLGLKAASLACAAVGLTFTLMKRVNIVWGVAATLFGGLNYLLQNKLFPVSIWDVTFKGQRLGMATLGALMEHVYKPILVRARKENIPILDLPNTFNPYKNLYTSQIEPNNEGGKLIAEGLAHIIKHHQFGKDVSILYAKGDEEAGFTSCQNSENQAWRVRYIKAL